MKKFWNEFKAFAFKGNVIDMAVGVIIGGAFSTIVNSLINDVLMPAVGLLFKADFSDWGLVLSENPDNLGAAAASAAGLTVLSYGNFISAIINFFIIALTIFIVIRLMNKAKDGIVKKEAPAPAKAPRLCPFCRMEIADDATRCPHCTSELPKE